SMSTSKLLFFLRYFTTFLLIWILASLGAEAAFRSIGDRPSANMKNLYMQFGAAYKPRPMADTGADWSTGSFSVHTDALGLRCDRLRHMGTRPGDAIDILFLGDSQGFGNGLDFEETIPGTVAKLGEDSGYTVR